MNEVFRFLSGNDLMHKVRRVNKMCNTILRDVGPLQAERVIVLKHGELAYSAQNMKNLEEILNYTDNVIISNEYCFIEDY